MLPTQAEKQQRVALRHKQTSEAIEKKALERVLSTAHGNGNSVNTTIDSTKVPGGLSTNSQGSKEQHSRKQKTSAHTSTSVFKVSSTVNPSDLSKRAAAAQASSSVLTQY